MTDAADRMIRFECECGNRVAVSREFAGRKGKCSQCGKAIRVPTPDEKSSLIVPVAKTIPVARQEGADMMPAPASLPVSQLAQVSVNVAMASPVASEERTLWEGRPSFWHHFLGFLWSGFWIVGWLVLALYAYVLCANGLEQARRTIPDLRQWQVDPALAGFYARIASLLLSAWAGWGLMCRILAYLNLHFTVTSQRLRIQQGMLARELFQIELFRMKDIAVWQTFWGRLLDYANIRIISSDRLVNDLVLVAVPGGVQIAEQIRQASQQARSQSGMTMIRE